MVIISMTYFYTHFQMKELSKYYHQGLRIKFNIDLQDLKDEQMPTVVSGKKLSESSEVRPGMCCV